MTTYFGGAAVLAGMIELGISDPVATLRAVSVLTPDACANVSRHVRRLMCSHPRHPVAQKNHDFPRAALLCMSRRAVDRTLIHA